MKPHAMKPTVINTHSHWVWNPEEGAYELKEGMPRPTTTHPTVQKEVEVFYEWQPTTNLQGEPGWKVGSVSLRAPQKIYGIVPATKKTTKKTTKKKSPTAK